MKTRTLRFGELAEVEEMPCASCHERCMRVSGRYRFSNLNYPNLSGGGDCVDSLLQRVWVGVLLSCSIVSNATGTTMAMRMLVPSSQTCASGLAPASGTYHDEGCECVML
jgi:hypothetical protein